MPTPFWLLLIVAVIGLCSWAYASAARPACAGSNVTTTVSARQVKGLNRAQIKAMLQRIAAAPAPKPIMGAMCYKPAMPPKVAEYICPVCGEKTVFAEREARYIQWELTSCRNLLKEIQKTSGDAVTLDESACCRKCRPETTAPSFALDIHFDDGTARRIAPTNAEQLRLLRDFLAGKLAVKGSNDGEAPLKSHLPELEKLLGETPAN